MYQSTRTIQPRIGAEIFEGTSYPRTWAEFSGQSEAVARLRAATYSARLRREPMDRVLIATGLHGVGKTALAKLVAADLGTALVEVQGAIKLEEAREILASLQDYDVLFWDELHQAVQGGKAKAEWLLPLLQDGVLVGRNGVERLPRITVKGATTDVQRLPETILSRFQVRPNMTAYSDSEAELITMMMAVRIFAHPDLIPPLAVTCRYITAAANNNPREIDALLTVLRDAALVHPELQREGDYDLDLALRWARRTPDGLDQLAHAYLTTLFTFGGTAGERTMAAALGEPTPPRHTEKLLMRKGLVIVTANGRQLTDTGVKRVLSLLDTPQAEATYE